MTGAELRALRETAGLSQGALAKLLRKNRQTVMRWELEQSGIGYAEEQLVKQVLRRRVKGVT